jgi:hypothetical protein
MQTAGHQPVSEGLITAGWVTAILLPIVGFIIGCVLLTRRPSHGVAMMVVAIVASIAWYGSIAGF